MNKRIILSILCCLIGWVAQTEAQTVQDRGDSFNMNQKLGNGIVFGSIMWTFENTERYDIRDFELARDHDFNHVRICARMQNMQSSTGVLSEQSMDQLVAIIDDALANELIAVICPFFWWKATLANEPPAFSNDDISALADMWEQIALRCKEEGYSLEEVVFELIEEPVFGIDVERLIEECVNKIKAVEHRYIIIPGRGFKTIVGMGRVFNDNDIPLDYDRLIGTFHFYEPKCAFCNLYQSACGVTTEPSAYMPWPNETYDEAALRSWFVTLDQQNANWASRNGTVKLPLYMGEYGTLNKPSTGSVAGRIDLPREERKHWIWWTRMVAEEFGISTAYWNAYGNTSFGLGNWNQNNPAARNMADPADPTDEDLIRHSLLGRYEAEDLKSVASTSGFSMGSDIQTSHDYISFLGTAPSQELKFDNIYVGMDGIYNVTIRFSSAHTTELHLDIQSQQPDSTPLTSRTAVPFAITGASNWYAKTIPMELKAGINTIELSGTTGDLRIDFIGVTQANKVFMDQRYNVIGQDDRMGSELEAWRAEAYERIDQIRKSDLTITVNDSMGTPITGAEVRVHLTRHQFLWGAAVGSSWSTSPYRNEYKEIFLKYFNASGHQWALKPKHRGTFVEQQTADAWTWFRENGIYMRGHTMVWEHTNWWDQEMVGVYNDTHLSDLEKGERLKELADAHLYHAIPKWDVECWDVMNEPLANHMINDLLPENTFVHWFKLADEIRREHTDRSNVQFFINDYQILSAISPWALSRPERYRDVIDEMLAEGAPIEGIGFQARIKNGDLSPETVYQRMQDFDHYSLPYHITEFEIRDTDSHSYSDDEKRRITNEMMTIYFSYPKVEGLWHWTFNDNARGSNPWALFEYNGDPYPCGDEWMRTMDEVFDTDVAMVTDENGNVRVRGFKGDYEITVTSGQTQVMATVTLDEDTSAVVDLNLDAFSDLPVQTGLLMHLDASILSGVNESDSIDLWPNLAAPGTGAIPESTESAPTFHANALNGQPVVRFDGADDWMDVGDLRTDAGPIEVFVVTQSSDTGDGDWQNLISSFTDGPDNDTAPNWSLLRPHDSGTPLAVAPSILTKSESAGFSLGGISLARRGFDQAAFYGGDIAETIIYDRTLESWERNQLEYHLAHKYGLDIANYVNASDDTDLDGFSDYAELIAGTSLDDPNDYFSVALDASSESFQMQWNSVAGRDYIIWRSYDLSNWQTIETVSGDDLQKLFEESISLSDAVFYRMEITHP
ncbi:MAG: hypothetical protein F7O42_03025 [Opitutae bacterium]|nr:hypothetical protein [Opitutae bacterium]